LQPLGKLRKRKTLLAVAPQRQPISINFQLLHLASLFSTNIIRFFNSSPQEENDEIKKSKLRFVYMNVHNGQIYEDRKYISDLGEGKIESHY
jgi:hypothetical protein